MLRFHMPSGTCRRPSPRRQSPDTYPGLYVPSPLILRRRAGDHDVRTLAAEVLALTKMNWNNTQFDGGWPITIGAARKVGEILRFVPEHGAVATGYAFYM